MQQHASWSPEKGPQFVLDLLPAWTIEPDAAGGTLTVATVHFEELFET